MISFKCPECGCEILYPVDCVVLRCPECGLVGYYEENFKQYPVDEKPVNEYDGIIINGNEFIINLYFYY